MNRDGYIYVHNWDRFQGYRRDRGAPPWLRLYVAVQDTDEWMDLSSASRGLLVDLWMAVSRTGNGRLGANRKSLARRFNVRRVILEPLIDAGFIEVLDVKAPSEWRPLGRPRAEQSRADESRAGR